VSDVLFLASEPLGSVPSPAAIVQGVPYDGGVSWRPGTAEAPRVIREASDSIESFSPLLRGDLEDIALADAGDVVVGPLRAAAVIDRIAERAEQLAHTGALLVTIGGDHSISMGTSRGLRAAHPDLAHVVFDAHLDMREDYEGDRYSHACGTRRMAQAGPTCVLGVRSGSRDEFADADAMLVAWSDDVAMPDAMRAAIDDRPVFVSVDLDVLDPSILPGTGNPEPAGVAYRDLRAALLALKDARVVGIDFCEVSPPIDASGLSAIVAAGLIRDTIIALVR